MKCAEVYIHICDSLDENMNSPRCRKIKRHLQHCPDCRLYLESLKTTIALYRAMPEPRMPAAAHRVLFRTIGSLTAVQGGNASRPQQGPRRKRAHPKR